MSLAVHVDLDLGPLRRFTKDIPGRIRAALKRALTAAGRDVVGRAKVLAPGDAGGLRRSMDSTVVETPDAISAVIFSRVKYALFVHGGAKFTRKMPPPRALLQWARRHLGNRRAAHSRIVAEAAGVTSGRSRRPRVAEDEALSLAWAVAKAIKKRGFLPARPFLKQAFNERKHNVENLIRLAVRDELQRGTA